MSLIRESVVPSAQSHTWPLCSVSAARAASLPWDQELQALLVGLLAQQKTRVLTHTGLSMNLNPCTCKTFAESG